MRKGMTEDEMKVWIAELEVRLATAHALLRRAQGLLVEWHQFYGEGRPTPASLPPSGDIELQEAIQAALRPGRMG
jgi:hypothetical protein